LRTSNSVVPRAAGDGDTGSTPAPTSAAAVDVCATPGGDVVDSLSVSGDFGTLPVVDFTAPLADVDETQVAVAIDGGTEVAPGASVQAAYLMINGTTGEVVDTFGYGEGETPIDFRADIDALEITEETDVEYASTIPGMMHACGHDAHAAILLGAAELIGARAEVLPHRIRLVFQPSEETCPGVGS